MLDCGYLRRNSALAWNAFRDLAGSGRVDLMQQILQLLTHKYGRTWSESWRDALVKACKCGELPTARWLVMQQAIPRNYSFEGILEAAAEYGHHAVLQYLCDQKFRKKYSQALEDAIRNGHLKCVEVLLTQLLRDGEYVCYVIDYAASQETWQWLNFYLLLTLRKLCQS